MKLSDGIKTRKCPDCHGRGGEIERVLDDGSGPWVQCVWCNGTGEMPLNRMGHWLNLKKEERLEEAEHIVGMAASYLDKIFNAKDDEKWVCFDNYEAGRKYWGQLIRDKAKRYLSRHRIKFNNWRNGGSK